MCDDPINVPEQKVFTPKQMSERIRKLRPGKGSPDGCTAELFHGLPMAAVCSLAVFLTCVLLTLQIPHMWTQRKDRTHSQDCRTIESGQISRDSLSDGCPEIAGVLDLGDAPRFGLLLCPCGFVPHHHASEGVCRIKRILEVCREWDRSVHVVQIDLSKAFGRVLHSSVLQALRLQSASLQFIAVVAAMLSECELAVRLGHVITDPIKLHRGLPQGAPESHLLFEKVGSSVNVGLRPWDMLMTFWFSAKTKTTWRKCWESSLTRSQKSALTSVWTSVLGRHILLKTRDSDCWWFRVYVKSMTSVGTVINFSGNDGEAILNRLRKVLGLGDNSYDHRELR